MPSVSASVVDNRDETYMRRALSLARKGLGQTSPNPMVGAVLVKQGRIIGQGWHRRAGLPHAEIEALDDARSRGAHLRGATLYVTLEPCSTHGRTPPCTDAIIDAGIKQVVYAAKDPNPAHAGRGFGKLRRAGVEVRQGPLSDKAAELNATFNHWIVHHSPLVTVKAAMTLDGKIATATGDSKWITGPEARREGMNLRQRADAILVGVNTVLADNPSLTFRPETLSARASRDSKETRPLRRIILDSTARTPLDSRVITDDLANRTTIVVTRAAASRRVAALRKQADVLVLPRRAGRIDLRRLLLRLGAQQVTSLLVEGGGEVNASFLLNGLAQRIAFFYAPKIIGGANAIKAVSGRGVTRLEDALRLTDVHWRRLGPDLLLTAHCESVLA